jgi:hypothetical protein
MRGMPEVGLGRMEWASEAWFQATNHAESSFHPGATWWQTDRGAMARGRMAMAKPPGIAGHSPSAPFASASSAAFLVLIPKKATSCRSLVAS